MYGCNWGSCSCCCGLAMAAGSRSYACTSMGCCLFELAFDVLLLDFAELLYMVLNAIDLILKEFN